MGQNNRNKFASNQVTLKIATSLASGQSASTSFCFPFHSCLCPPCLAISHTRIATGPHPIIPSQKWILKLLKQGRSTTQHPKAQHENQLPMCEPLPSPRQSHSQNDPKTSSGATAVRFSSAASTLAAAEISCSTTAAWPFSSRLMQRRLASGAEDATRKAGLLRLPIEKQSV